MSDRLVDQIAQAMWVGLGENEQSCEWADIPDHWEDRANFLKGAEVVLDSIKKSWTLLPNVDGGWSLTLEDDGPSPVSLDEPERAALRSACSKCGGVVSLEAVCGSCGDMPAGSLTENEGMESWTEWRACWGDGLPASPWRRDRSFAEGVHRLLVSTPEGGFVEERTMWASRPVRVEEQGGEN